MAEAIEDMNQGSSEVDETSQKGTPTTKTENQLKTGETLSVDDTGPLSPAHRASWWWGVIPAVAAAVLLLFWLTGQFEEVFGIDPRGNWQGESIAKVAGPDRPMLGMDPSGRKVRWEMLIDDIAGDIWVKIGRGRAEVLSGPVTIEDNSILLKNNMGTFHGVYQTSALRFRYNPFTPRFMDAVIVLANGEAYSIRFRRM